MTMLEESYTLNNGIEIPKIGFGTWMIDDEKAGEAVRNAIALGYRHIDTAQAYGNERGVGEGLRASGISRDELFVTTKLEAEIKTLDQAREAIDGSLQKLKLDVIDMMIIHSPQPWKNFRNDEHYFEGNLAAWRALEEAVQAGKLRAIGVSNFERVDLENILANGSIAPAVNQILAHVGNTPTDLIDFCQSKDILVEAYSPFGHGEILGDPQLETIAGHYGVSVPQLAVRYLLQLGLLPLPKASSEAHMRSNADVDFGIEDDDMKRLADFEPIKDYGSASRFPVYSKGLPVS